MRRYCTPDASSPYCQRLRAYIDMNFNVYIQTMIKDFADVDPYWHQVTSAKANIISTPSAGDKFSPVSLLTRLCRWSYFYISLVG